MPRPPVGRQQLLAAARDEIVRGNGSVDLASLTNRAKLSTGAVYHHFGSKAGLLAAIYNDFYDGLKAAIADAHLPADGTWAIRERERTRAWVVYHFDNPLAQYMLDRSATDPLLSELEAAYLQELISTAAVNIRRGQRQGQIPRGVDADVAAAYIIGGLRHGIAQQLRVHPRRTADHATEKLWRLIAATLGIE